MRALANEAGRAHIYAMKARHPVDEKLSEADGVPERGYDAWKRAKIEAAVEQAKDRTKMIPSAQILRNFGIER